MAMTGLTRLKVKPKELAVKKDHIFSSFFQNHCILGLLLTEYVLTKMRRALDAKKQKDNKKGFQSKVDKYFFI